METIITSYAKKSDLNGLMNEEQVTTIATAEAGKIKTTLSSQISTIDDKVNGIKARPTYTIGSDGYWYKDGKKTDTKAIGADGDGFKWNLIDDGNTKVTAKDGKYIINEHGDKGTDVSIAFLYQGPSNNTIRFKYNGKGGYSDVFSGRSYVNMTNDSVSSPTVYTYSDTLYRTIDPGGILYLDLDNDDKNACIYWVSLVIGDRPVKTFLPSRKDIQGKDGKTGPQGKQGVDGKDGHTLIANVEFTGTFRNYKMKNIKMPISATYDGSPITLDSTNTVAYYMTSSRNEWNKDSGVPNLSWSDGNREFDYIAEKIVVTYKGLVAEAVARLDNVNDGRIYASSSPPSDHNVLWFNTNDNETYAYYNGSWYNINTKINTIVHDVQDTVSSHTRTITSINGTILNNTTKITKLEQNLDGFKQTVQNQNYLSIINQQADRQIFQVSNGRTTGKLMITPSTVYIKDATIKNSHIDSLSASKLTAGTIDAKDIRVINIDAANITTGKLSGYRGIGT